MFRYKSKLHIMGLFGCTHKTVAMGEAALLLAAIPEEAYSELPVPTQHDEETPPTANTKQ
eukprot:scaffold36321_cov63-Attheya_sp.AAC.3